MLKRIKLIKNIGKFYNCQPPGVGFGRETVIYGRNSDGKSTLTAIFRSLFTGNIAILKGRKSFGASSNKEIELVLGNGTTNQDFIFQNMAWNQLYKKIHIFDTRFIYENIYEGEAVEVTHKSNLHRVIIGEVGKNLMQEIENISEKVRTLEQNKKELISEYNGSTFGNHFSIDDFLNIPEDNEIDEKIKKKDRQIVFESQLSKPNIINLPDIALDRLRSTLEKEFKSSHDEAERRLLIHIDAHWKDKNHSKMFIKDGLSLVTDLVNLRNAECPFCGQSLLPATELIKHYQDYFDEEYKKFRESLIQEVDAFKKINIDNLITTTEFAISSWRQFLGEEYSENIIRILTDCKTSLLASKRCIEEECDKKIIDLNYKVVFEKIDEFNNEFRNFMNLVNNHNEKVRLYIASYSGKSLEDLKHEMGRLRTIKARYFEKWIKYCEAYKDVITNITNAKIERDGKMSTLSSYTNDIFDKHQSAINTFLKEMGVDFRIVALCEQRDLRRAASVVCGYEIEFFSQDRIPLDDIEEKPSMKNCLSHGDKSALAFAFFLSLVCHDAELENKLIIFDDPISSFDTERKRKTAHLLFDFVSQSQKRPDQLIIMTHETQFLRMLYEAADNHNVQYIKINQDGMTNEGRKKSTIEHCDVVEEFLQSKEVKQLKRIKQYAYGNEVVPEELRKDCREVIEAVFKIKYYIQLEDEITKKQSIQSFLNKLCVLKMPGYDTCKQNQLSRLFNNLHIPHHSSMTENLPELSTGDLKSILLDTLDELKKL